MDKEKFNDFLRRRYYPALTQYRKRAFSNQQMSKTIQWLTIALSIITSILIGVEQFFDWMLIKLMALVTSVIVSGLATASKTFSYQEKWSFYNKMSRDLENEFDMYNARSDLYTKETDKESFFVTRIIALLNEGTDNVPTLTTPPPSSISQEHLVENVKEAEQYKNQGNPK